MANPRIWTLIQRYVTGNIFPEERRELRRWMDENPENKHIVQEVERIWDLTPEEEFETDIDSAWEEFRSNVMTTGRQREFKIHPHGSSKHLVYIYRAVAAVLVFLFSGYFAMEAISNLNTQQAAAPVMQLQEMTTGIGDNAMIRFSDGSEVILNSSSSLWYPSEFGSTQREVYLQGEAFFNVASNPDHPFVVHSQEATVKVLGTEFNVRGWDDDETVHVAVREGVVTVNSFDQQSSDYAEVLLTEGLSTTVRSGNAPSEPMVTDVENYLLWTVGGLHFENVPFRQVIRDIERRFRIEITEAPDPLLDVPYTGTFQSAELNEVLSVVAASLEIEYDREGNTVQFR